MTHCRSCERTYGLEALWRYEGTEHSKLPHRSGACPGWSEAVINSNVRIFVSSGKLLLSFYRCCQAPGSTKRSQIAYPTSARALHPRPAQDSDLSLGWQFGFKVWHSCADVKTFFWPCLLAGSPIQTPALVPHLLCPWLSEDPISNPNIEQSNHWEQYHLWLLSPEGAAIRCWALTPMWLVWRSKGKGIYQMWVLKQSNDTKRVQNYLNLSFLLAELPSVQFHGSFNITRKLFMEGTVGGKKKIPSVWRAGC